MPNQYTAHPLSPDERLWDKVQKTETCWLWTGTPHPDGYARLKIDRRNRHAHSYAWWLATGVWPTSAHPACHTCDVRACVRNDDEGTYEVDGILYERRGHLWLGTPAANMRDMAIKGRGAIGDLNGSRLHPERLQRGAESHSHLHPELRPRGEAHARSKLTVAGVLEIRACHAAGGNLAELARVLKLNKTTVHRVARGKTWRHI